MKMKMKMRREGRGRRRVSGKLFYSKVLLTKTQNAESQERQFSSPFQMHQFEGLAWSFLWTRKENSWVYIEEFFVVERLREFWSERRYVYVLYIVSLLYFCQKGIWTLMNEKKYLRRAEPVLDSALNMAVRPQLLIWRALHCCLRLTSPPPSSLPFVSDGVNQGLCSWYFVQEVICLGSSFLRNDIAIWLVSDSSQ